MRNTCLLLAHEKTCPFNNTLCFPFTIKSSKCLCNFQDMPFCSNLNMIPPCQTLSNAFKMSKNTSNFVTTVKRFVNIMSYRPKLIYTGIPRFKTRLIQRNLIVFNKKIKHFLEYQFLKYFTTHR